MKPRFIVALCLVSVLFLGAVGCGSGGSSTSAQSTASVGQTSPQGEADTPSSHKGGEASIEEFGTEAAGSEREAILSVFEGNLRAIADKDYATACSYLSSVVQSSLERLAGGGSKAECASTLPALLAPTAAALARAQANGEVTKVRFEGERGFVVFKAPGAKLYQQTMVEEGGEWKVAVVAAAVLVPEL